MTFRTNLQSLRAQRNMTQEQLAMLLGVSRQSISKWESEKAYPEMDKLLAICDLFGCTLDDLVLGDVNHPMAAAAGEATASASDGDAGNAMQDGASAPASGSGTVVGAAAAAAPAAPIQPARPAAPASATSLPRDLTGYDDHRRRFALMIAAGVAAIIGGVAVSSLFDSESPIVPLPAGLADVLMFLCISVGVIVGLALLIPGSMAHAVFKRRHPYVEDFYTEDDRSRETRLLAVGIVAGIAAILIGIVVAVYMDEVLGVGAGWPIAVMLLLDAAAVFGFVYVGIRYGMLDIAAYNKETDKERRVRAGRLNFHEKLAGAASGIIMLVATIVGLTLLFLSVPLFWLSWVIGGLLCAITGVVIGFLKDMDERK
ncbi:helix-turn-helix transcriptional regulator [Bifidobacterium leontopitheci]|uniref:XRE family transcriptional regulator n=1 Tax=Bifidobacterium leontopitheci TaxID=2650774 RepID=A0A6I1GDZ6_9BIFI|nr:helix-turn-helix transcriptional regulator [Bifidobacterium leontopitheci]KAB7789853.1 XRE family transcriptional regulator [Bifidobacterium leontopitheci]